MKTKRISSKDDSSSASQDTNSTVSLYSGNNSVLGKRAADVLASSDLSAFGEPKPDSKTLREIRESAERLAYELNDFLTKNEVPTTKLLKYNEGNGSPDFSHMTDEAIADLQLATARKLRELLPRNRDLLFTARENQWIPILLNWLTFHDRPAVQVESLLALTNIAELCAQQSYYQHTQAQSSAVAAAAQAAAAAVKGDSSSSSFSMFGYKDGQATYPYPSLVAPAPGSVPFPPLSFSQTLSPEAVASFDASLTATIQNSKRRKLQESISPLSHLLREEPIPLFQIIHFSRLLPLSHH
ncbi:unnamed protein product [Pseudo-nitzschia multistriata]|uniref:Uncharacterized protein n=1 Tax=Pseudo-nitzschia multistriata TaxID=183589 RepID=A0A448ZG91_9STRA|nr:unnamed protein product [Pseudo-nitzschia multistriata]